ncbi:hypothetical protein [Paraburkholderia fungorum]|uniref:Uncharacterized protein n=1 Tax=Paraburkholderia fungorum TaxID=134537 RepID=A0AAW3USS5_9BURK|nr:hypothetical protein [Paraburkholderia fungorum]KFX66307.1 hypothetical protein KBK24_0104275 [Burkholderia sp. K24]MBB4513176.1 hypothetical protein [Paraburkholderia fungorum]MBB6201398.1 hypothetical protein [Paraburkholderia fungorum]USX05434.1 hypothetical protein NHH62_04700 [Paraburkholderia fungorum]
MTKTLRKMGFSLYILQAVGILGVLISLAHHRVAEILIFGLLTGLSGVLINRIVRQNPGVLQRSGFITRIHMLFLWSVIGCIALLLIGPPLLQLLNQHH